MKTNYYNIIDRYLFDNHTFVDKRMINLAEQRDDYILTTLEKATVSIGLYIDKDRLKRWVNFCTALDNVDKGWIYEKAKENKFYELHNEIERLRNENYNLWEENKMLRKMLEG